MPEFYTKIARKIFFPNVGGTCPPLVPAPSPTPMQELSINKPNECSISKAKY